MKSRKASVEKIIVVVDDYRQQRADAAKRVGESIKELNKIYPISYVDDEGYIVERSPNGTATRIAGYARIKR